MKLYGKASELQTTSLDHGYYKHINNMIFKNCGSNNFTSPDNTTANAIKFAPTP